jgi:hypothetical protein
MYAARKGGDGLEIDDRLCGHQRGGVVPLPDHPTGVKEGKDLECPLKVKLRVCLERETENDHPVFRTGFGLLREPITSMHHGHSLLSLKLPLENNNTIIKKNLGRKWF